MRTKSRRKSKLTQWVALLAVGALALGCAEDGGGSDGESDKGGDAGDGDGDEGSAEGDGTAQPPGPSADGWASDYADGGVRISCDDDAATLEASNAPRLTFGDSTVYVGYEQVGDNQNPIVARFDGGQRIWCQKHETEGPDGRALGITWDGGNAAYVVYTIVGGGSSLEGKGGWLSSYAPGAISGGGPKVSYVGGVAMTDGSLSFGTFIISVLSSNKVNSHSPAGAVTVLSDGSIEFLGSSAHKPIDADGKNWMDCEEYPFDTKYVFEPELGEIICAQSTNCTSQMPCD